jgi:flagellar biosynthesis protein FliQ
MFVTHILIGPRLLCAILVRVLLATLQAITQSIGVLDSALFVTLR